MRFPIELWTDPADAALATATAEGFAFFPIILTDRLANAVFINEAAESIFRDRAEALVNRTTLSLLGFEKADCLPEGLTLALQAKSGPWRGVVMLDVAGGAERRYIEASAVHRDGELICGILRIAEHTT
jgi:hypothetical protein